MTDTEFYIKDTEPEGKGRILREGLRLFAQNGLPATSIRDIAAATGMSNPALYKHFATKHDLALVLFERLYRAHLQELTRAVGQHSGFADSFSAYIAAVFEAYDAHPHATVFVSANLVTLWPEMPQDLKKRTGISILRDLLVQGRALGLVAKGADIELQVALVVGMQTQVTRQLYLGALKGPAMAHASGSTALLRAGLA